MQNRKLSILTLICISTMLPLATIHAKESFFKRTKDRVFGFFKSYTHEKVVNNEYTLTNPGTLTLNNFDGDITIKTDWNRNAVCVKATKRASKEETLPLITIKNVRKTVNDKENLTIATAYANNEVKAQVDYELIVPSDMRLQLTTQRGMIIVNDVNGAVAASTTHGSIELNNTQKLVVANTQQSGSISINDAKGPIQATANNGNILIKDACDSIIASTEYGTINSVCSNVPENGRIKLDATSGAIILALPSETNATLRGHTQRGTLTSNHRVKINSHETQLNRKAWNQFRKEVDGTLGTGEADIQLSCKSGNIKIVETITA